jgi:undecaprenyl diphosphate synthase
VTEALEHLPRHVAIIMDGNGRWAKSRGLPRAEGHRRGADSVRAVTRASRRIGIRALTLYAFSEQNWNRPPDEVEALMNLLRDYLLSERAEILDHDIRLTTIGNTAHLPGLVREPLEELIRVSASNQSMDLCLALSYGGREEITAACTLLAERVRAGQLDPAELTDEAISASLWSSHLPPVDLIIRTSGEQRLSNFMLWHAAYAELYFTPTLWPDFGEVHLREALAAFEARERRFGMTSEQVQALQGGHD